MNRTSINYNLFSTPFQTHLFPFSYNPPYILNTCQYHLLWTYLSIYTIFISTLAQCMAHRKYNYFTVSESSCLLTALSTVVLYLNLTNYPMLLLLLAAQSCPTLCSPRDCRPPRLLCAWNSPGKNTGVSSYSLLQGIFPNQGWNLGLLYCRQILNHLSHYPRLFSNAFLSLKLTSHLGCYSFFHASQCIS